MRPELNMPKPLQAELWVFKGIARYELAQFEAAIECYNEAIRFGSPYLDLEEIWYNKGAAFFGLGEYEKALVCFDVAIELKPKDKDNWVGKAETLEALGRIAESNAAFSESMRLNYEKYYLGMGSLKE